MAVGMIDVPKMVNDAYAQQNANQQWWQNRAAQSRQKAGIPSQPSPYATAAFNNTAGQVRNAVNGAQNFANVRNTVNTAKTAAANPYGSQSGPGILESWFNQRANGTDPAFEYAMKRGTNQLDNQFAAAGSFNSGAARQADSDLYANLISQRMGQLDSLAGGASGEHQSRLNSMFSQGQGIAGGMAGLSSAYDLGAAGNMAAANNAQQQMALNRSSVDSQSQQAFINNILAAYGISKSGGGGNNPYGNSYGGDPYGGGYDYGKV